jgi:hypothetical protein
LTSGKDIVLYTVLVDPEVLKDELNRMVEESRVELYLHSWGVQAIMEGECIKGVIIESKSGRRYWGRLSLILPGTVTFLYLREPSS